MAFVVARLVMGLCLAASPGKAAEESWIVLSDDLASWQAPTGQWFIAGGAAMDSTNPRRLTTEPGRGVLVNGKEGVTDNLVSRRQFGDVEVQLEFMVPRRSNSGVKLQGLYEIQIADTPLRDNAPPNGDDCGGVYPRAELRPVYHHIDAGVPPRVRANKPAGEWQTLQIVFRSPRFDAAGQKTASARFEKVVLNGKVIHENVEVRYPTGHIWRQKEQPSGPLLLQADHGPVAFRNVRLRPLPLP
jgi:hypothetical protein